MIKKGIKYLGEVRQEMNKVIWPSRLEIRDSAVIVIVLSLILAVFVFGIDIVLNNILRIIL